MRLLCPSNSHKRLTFHRHDTSPSFLKHTLRPSSPNSEPSQKKARLSDTPASDASTIATKLSSSSYSNLQLLIADASRVCDDLVSSIRTKPKDSSNSGRPSVEELKSIHRIQHFEAMLKETVITEDGHVKPEVKEEHVPEEDAAASRKAGTVLTLFGNAPTPKQLFSSVQNTSVERKASATTIELPVDEMSLPNGISATKIVPVSARDDKKGPTFEDTFAPPFALAVLAPPKAHKRSITRDTTINWEFKDPIQRNSRKGGYTVQALTVGKWLGYGGVDPLSDSTREKRKQRERALSGGEKTDPPQTQASLDDALAKEEAALFRRAYSSYAPPYDNSNVVVSEIEKNTVWWSKVGRKRFNSTFAIDPALLDEHLPTAPPEVPTEKPAINDEELGKVMENLDSLEEIEMDAEPVRSKTDVDDVLRQIAELLETLESHQRIRNATLPASIVASRVPISPAPAALKPRKPDEPSEEEVATYDSLRREIAYLVLKLPPYAVAKLDGDQLADLGVSTLITFQSRNTRGSLEEDLVTRQAKAAAAQTAQSLASLTNRPTSSAGQHYSTTAQRTPAIGQAANTRYGPSYPGRPSVPTPSFGRSTSNQQSYGTPGSAAPRPSYGGANTYTRPGASQSSFGQANGQQYYQQRPLQTANSYGGLGQYQQPAQTPQQRAPSFPAQPQYPPRSQGVANYPMNNTPQQGLNRTASPGGYSSPMLPQQQHLAAAQQRQQQNMYPGQQPQSNSGRATPVNNYPSQPNTPVNGYQQQQQRSVAPRPTSSTPQPPQAAAPAPAPAPAAAAPVGNGTL